jgi:hypothetical protein
MIASHREGVKYIIPNIYGSSTICIQFDRRLFFSLWTSEFRGWQRELCQQRQRRHRRSGWRRLDTFRATWLRLRRPPVRYLDLCRLDPRQPWRDTWDLRMDVGNRTEPEFHADHQHRCRPCTGQRAAAVGHHPPHPTDRVGARVAVSAPKRCRSISSGVCFSTRTPVPDAGGVS